MKKVYGFFDRVA